MEEMLKKMMSNEKEELAKKIRDNPNQTNEVQLPNEMANKVVELRSVRFDTSPFPTIIIATQTTGYTQEQFNRDVDKVKDYFNLKNYHLCEILLKPINAQFPDVVNSGDAANQLEKAVQFIIQGMSAQRSSDQVNPNVPSMYQVAPPVQNLWRLRIVSLGVKYSRFYFHALEYLLNHWQSPEKSVQFVTKGDDEHYSKLRFCKTACINNLVSKVEFVNLSEYLPFGYYHDGKGKRLFADPAAKQDDAAAAPAAASH